MTIPPEPPGADARLPLGTQLFRFVATGGVSAVVDLGMPGLPGGGEEAEVVGDEHEWRTMHA